VQKIPRRKGIAGFYSLVVLIGLLFFIPAIKNSKMAGTSLMGISRFLSSKKLSNQAISYTLIASMQT